MKLQKKSYTFFPRIVCIFVCGWNGLQLEVLPLSFLQYSKTVSVQDPHSMYGQARIKIINFFNQPEVASKWRVARKVAFLNIEGTNHYTHNQEVIHSLQQICCGFCRAPPTLIGAAWEDITPVWLQRPAHQP